VERVAPYRSGYADAVSLPPEVADAPWLGPREVAEAPGWPMLPLGGTPSVDLPEHIVSAVTRVAKHLAYPGTTGSHALRSAIAVQVSQEFGRPIDPDREVLITSGSMQALFIASMVLVGHKQNAVAHSPSFFYKDLVDLCGGEGRWVGDEDDGPPNWPAIRRALDSNTSALFVNSPCNPTTYVFTHDDLDELATAAADFSGWIVSDEAYMGYVYDGRRHLSPACHPDLAGRTVVVRSFSKTYALGAWRIGFVVAPEAVISPMAKVLQWMSIGVDSIAQVAAHAALTGPQDWVAGIVSDLEHARHSVVSAINETGFLRARLPQAGTTVWARITTPDLTEDAVSRKLGRDYGVPAVPGRYFGSRNPYVRIPFGGEPAARPRLLDQLANVAESWLGS
jgi:aspartate aminotransferase